MISNKRGPQAAKKTYQKISSDNNNDVNDNSDNTIHEISDMENNNNDNSSNINTHIRAESSTTNVELGLNENTPLIKDQYPKEYLKTLLSVVLLFLGALIGAFVIGYIHRFSVGQQRPLPDLVFNWIAQQQWAWAIADQVVMSMPVAGFVFLIFHKYWTIVLRRLCLLAAVLYVVRAAFLLCTYLPPPFDDFHDRCLPVNFTDDASDYVWHAFSLVFTGGYSATDSRIMCGDTIYSGHTMVFLLVCLFAWNYMPKPLYPVIPIALLILASFGITMVIVGHQHYTIDVVVALFITYAAFYAYHVWAKRERVKRCFGTRPLTFRPIYRCFMFFEGNVKAGAVPCEFGWPLPKPDIFVKYFEKINEWANKSNLPPAQILDDV